MPPLQLTESMIADAAVVSAWLQETSRRLEARKVLRASRQRAARKGAETRRARV